MHIGRTRSVSGIAAFSTVCIKRTLLALTMLAAIGSAAQADTVKFYNGGAGYTGAFNGAGSVYAATSGAATDCPVGSPGCTLGGAPDILSPPQTFLASDDHQRHRQLDRTCGTICHHHSPVSVSGWLHRVARPTRSSALTF